MFGLQITPLIKIGAAFALIVGLFSFGYYKGYSHEKAKFDAYKTEVITVAKAQEAKVTQINKGASRINKDSANAYNSNVAAVREYYKRVRDHTIGSGSLSSIPETSEGADGKTKDELLGNCAETTLQLIYLQEWILKQEENYNNESE